MCVGSICEGIDVVFLMHRGRIGWAMSLEVKNANHRTKAARTWFAVTLRGSKPNSGEVVPLWL